MIGRNRLVITNHLKIKVIYEQSRNMVYRGLYDRKGELFAYLEGSTLHTLDGEVTGRLEGSYIVDTAGNRVWRVYDSGVYSLDEMEAIGYFGGYSPRDY